MVGFALTPALRRRPGYAKVGIAMERPHFTLEEANELLPWLAETLTGLMPVREELSERQQELLVLQRLRHGNGTSSKESQTVELQRTVDRLTNQLQRGLREINQKGIIVRDLSRWLVDFPSYRDAREIYLCWIRGEVQIAYWHDTNAGFSSRQPI